MTTTKRNFTTEEQLIIDAQLASMPLSVLPVTHGETAVPELLLALMSDLEKTDRLLNRSPFVLLSDAFDPDDDEEEVDEDDDDDLDDDDEDFDDDDDDEDFDDDDDADEPYEEAEEDEDDM